MKRFRDEKTMHWSMRARVACLKISKCGLKLSAQENFNREDVLSFVTTSWLLIEPAHLVANLQSGTSSKTLPPT